MSKLDELGDNDDVGKFLELKLELRVSEIILLLLLLMSLLMLT